MSAIIRKEVIGGQTLILGDCLQVMQELGRFDAVVTDPPYGIGRDKGMGKGGKRLAGDARRYEGGAWDAERPSPELIQLSIKAASHHVVWGGNYLTDMLPVSGKWLFWDKCQTMPSFSDGELAWTTLPGDAVKQFTYNGSGMQAREKGRVHPTQKPVALMEWCLGFLPSAKTILDPFAGSGTTAVACERMGRQCTAIEIDPDYFEVMCRRVDEQVRQPRFDLPEPHITAVQEDLF